MTLVAQGQDIRSIALAEELFQEGEGGEIRLYLNRPTTALVIQNLENKLILGGATLAGPIQTASTVMSISFQKRVPFLPILGPALASTGPSITGWQILKSGVQVGPILLLGAALLLLLGSVRS